MLIASYCSAIWLRLLLEFPLRNECSFAEFPAFKFLDFPTFSTHTLFSESSCWDFAYGNESRLRKWNFRYDINAYKPAGRSSGWQFKDAAELFLPGIKYNENNISIILYQCQKNKIAWMRMKFPQIKNSSHLLPGYLAWWASLTW